MVDTTECFIESNKGEDGTGQGIMSDIFDAVHFGWAQTDSYKRCLDLFGSFCTTKEINSTLKMRTQNKEAGKDYEEVVIKVRKELKGNLLQNKIYLARMAFIFVQIMNNMKVNAIDPKNLMYTFRPDPKNLRCTNPIERNKSGGWNKEGIRCDYFHYKCENNNNEKENSGEDGDSNGNGMIDYEDEFEST
eukprot:scaffold143853_cov46-Attheya_sp.AAC.1